MKKEAALPGHIERYKILFKGIVQGVGFRPYLYRSAQKFNLSGFVKNTSAGVILEVEGKNLDDFIQYIFNHLPPLSEIVAYDVSTAPLQFSRRFEIQASENTDKSDLLVSPDIAVCENCKKELSSPKDRRYRYPFINCTDCGPRLTIIQDLPYDRPKTTMSVFPMCAACREEYNDPLDRRYHAQPVSCFHCGPTLSFHDHDQGGAFAQKWQVQVTGAGGNKQVQPDSTESPYIGSPRRGAPGPPAKAFDKVIEKLKEGKIAAIKGLGGYHLACLGSSDAAVLRLRQLKDRERKPFALMGTLDMIERNCLVSETEKKHLLSPSAPILLLERKANAAISPHTAPGQNTIGFMVPYTPLHILLLQAVDEPLVMTSANISDEPIIYKDDNPALRDLADCILSHDREIHLFADDSVARVFDNRLYMVRRSRGYVPFPITIPFHAKQTILGLGPMLKTTFTFLRGNRALTGPYIGTTDTVAAIAAEKFAIAHYMKLFALSPGIIVMDKHPGYPNRLIAGEFKGAKVIEIQHHKAHVGSLLAEKGEKDPIIGISMDGTGYGDDGNTWGGEFFVGDYRQLTRFGHLKYLFLPAGDKSIAEPWRFALSVLYSLYGSADNAGVVRFAEKFGQKGRRQLEIIKQSPARFGILTSSCGRLFDAAASILGIGHFNGYDGDLPSLLQAAAEKTGGSDTLYGFSIEKQEKVKILNLLPLFHDIINDDRDVPGKAFIFHKTLAEGIVNMAEQAREEYKIAKAGLTGGVFQNTLLLRLTIEGLQAKGFQVLIHSDVPSNDGGISLGQVFLAAAADGILE